ncbi:MAG: anion permease, partial [Clostridia bacterium]|nr:anion permease [Clostridia bacterium]
MTKVKHFFKNNFIFLIVAAIALISCIIVPINKNYINYFDGAGETLTCIWGILIIVAGLENIDFFHKVARLIVKKFKSVRSIIISLIFITYISSLINANDMELLTFLPLSYLVLKYTNQTQYLAFTFIMQNIASNLGGMLSPIGNPQNIYLFSFYKIGLLEFFKI